MKRTTLSSAAALSSLLVLAACGGQADTAPAPTEEPAPVEEVAAPVEEAAPAPEVPAVEANGTIIEVEMYTRDPDGGGMQVFKPRLITAKVGDTVVFKPTNPTHQSSSIEGMLPAGVTGWEGEINQEVSYVLPAPGVYGYQCVPHYAAGMVGMIVVEGEGSDANVEAAKGVTHPGLAKKAFEEIFAEAGL